MRGMGALDEKQKKKKNSRHDISRVNGRDPDFARLGGGGAGLLLLLLLRAVQVVQLLRVQDVGELRLPVAVHAVHGLEGQVVEIDPVLVGVELVPRGRQVHDPDVARLAVLGFGRGLEDG